MSRVRTALVLSVQVPFTRGGAELLSEQLVVELRQRGIVADLVQLPFSALPKNSIPRQMALWRALDLREFAGRPVDLVIPTKFPSYLVSHPRKVPWIVHQHRQAYELYGTRFGDFDTSTEDEVLRQMILEADSLALKECERVYTIAQNVSERLKRYVDVDSTALRPPLPQSGVYRQGEKGKEILVVGRLCSIKRVDLVLRAFAEVERPLRLVLVGTADEPAFQEYLESEIEKHHLWDRVDIRGHIGADELLELYANCFAVCYVPFDEDYGFVTMEARACGKPVITANDSGTVLDVIEHQKNGLVCEPNEKSLAAAVNRLFKDSRLYDSISFVEDPTKVTATWDEIVEALVA